MKTIEQLCSKESHLSWVKMNIVLLKESIHSRPEFACVWPARKWHFVQASMGVCDKGCSSKAFSWVFFAMSASCFRICSSLDRIRFFMRNRTYVYLWTDLMNWIKKPSISLIKEFERHHLGFLGPLHMSPVNRAGSVSEISPRHSSLCKNIDVF